MYLGRWGRTKLYATGLPTFAGFILLKYLPNARYAIQLARVIAIAPRGPIVCGWIFAQRATNSIVPTDLQPNSFRYYHPHQHCNRSLQKSDSENGSNKWILQPKELAESWQQYVHIFSCVYVAKK